MLKKLSVVLQECGFKSVREYTFAIYRSLQQQGLKQTQFFDNAFVDQKSALLYEKLIRDRINRSIRYSSTEDFILLPPLFIVSNVNAIVQTSPELLLVLCESGPIFPVIWLKSQEDSIQETICHIYQPPEQVTPITQSPNQPTEPTVSNPSEQPCKQIVEEPSKQIVEQIEMVPNEPVPNEHEQQVTKAIQETPQPSIEYEMSLVKDMTKTPIACGLNLLKYTNQPNKATYNVLEQKTRCEDLCKMMQVLLEQCSNHEQILEKTHFAVSREILTNSLQRKKRYLEDTRRIVCNEHLKLIEALQVNEVTQRVICREEGADAEWVTKIQEEHRNLQECIDILNTIRSDSA